MTLAERLKKAREALGKNQKEMALTVGVSYRSWQGYEDGDNVPGGNVFEALARLGLNVNWLLTGEGPMKQGEERNVPSGEIDVELHVAVLNVVDELLESTEKQPTQEQKSRLIAALYRLASERKDRTVDRTTALQLVKLMAA